MHRPRVSRSALAATVAVVLAGCGGGATGFAPGQGPPPFTRTCTPLSPPQGLVIDVTPSQVGALPGIVAAANPGDTIRLADGTYPLNGALLLFRTPRVTLRSASGNSQAVVLDGNYQGGAIVQINASDVTIAEVTVRRAFHHPIHVYPVGPTITGTVIHRVRVIDPGEQAIKINPNGGQFADRGEIRCSEVMLTDAGRPFIRNNCYTGGIDAHQALGWVIYGNVIEGFWCPVGLSEHGIHIWTGSRDTWVDSNVLKNNARGIGFGLGESFAGRTYGDDPCPGSGTYGHFNGVILNNFVFANDVRLFVADSRNTLSSSSVESMRWSRDGLNIASTSAAVR